jgi:hypothetical protein
MADVLVFCSAGKQLIANRKRPRGHGCGVGHVHHPAPPQNGMIKRVFGSGASLKPRSNVDPICEQTVIGSCLFLNAKIPKLAVKSPACGNPKGD